MVDAAGAACFMRAKVGGAEAGEAGGELLSPSQRLVHALSSACRPERAAGDVFVEVIVAFYVLSLPPSYFCPLSRLC